MTSFFLLTVSLFYTLILSCAPDTQDMRGLTFNKNSSDANVLEEGQESYNEHNSGFSSTQLPNEITFQSSQITNLDPFDPKSFNPEPTPSELKEKEISSSPQTNEDTSISDPSSVDILPETPPSPAGLDPLKISRQQAEHSKSFHRELATTKTLSETCGPNTINSYGWILTRNCTYVNSMYGAPYKIQTNVNYDSQNRFISKSLVETYQSNPPKILATITSNAKYDAKSRLIEYIHVNSRHFLESKKILINYETNTKVHIKVYNNGVMYGKNSAEWFLSETREYDLQNNILKMTSATPVTVQVGTKPPLPILDVVTTNTYKMMFLREGGLYKEFSMPVYAIGLIKSEIKSKGKTEEKTYQVTVTKDSITSRAADGSYTKVIITEETGPLGERFFEPYLLESKTANDTQDILMVRKFNSKGILTSQTQTTTHRASKDVHVREQILQYDADFKRLLRQTIYIIEKGKKKNELTTEYSY